MIVSLFALGLSGVALSSLMLLGVLERSFVDAFCGLAADQPDHVAESHA